MDEGQAAGRKEALFESFMEGSPDAIIVTSSDRFVYVNSQASNLSGYSAQEFMNLSLEDIIASEYVDLVKSRLSRRLKGETISDLYEIEVVSKDGSRISVEISVALIDYDGNPATLTVIHDITERKKAEEALNRNIALLKEVQRIARLGNWEWNIVSGSLVWSDEIYTIFGLTPQEFGATYEAFLGYVHPEDRSMVENAVAEALKSNQYDIEHRIVLSTGEERTVHERGEVSYDENGNPIRMLGTVIDITEQKESEKALAESEEKYRGLFDSLMDAFYYCEMIFNDDNEPINYRYVEINDRYTELYGKGREIIGQLVTDVWPGIENDLINWIERYGSVAKTGEELRFEQYVAFEDMWVNVSAYSPKPGYIAAIIQDITERKKLESEIQAAEERERQAQELYQTRLEALHSSASRLAEAESLVEITVISMDILEKVLELKWCEMGFVDGDRFVWYQATDRETPYENRPSMGLDTKSIILRSIRTKETQDVPDVTKDPDYRWKPVGDEELRVNLSEVVVPILVDDRAVGAINTESVEKNAYAQSDIALLEILAQHVASSMSRLEHIEGLEMFQSRLEALHHSSVRLAEAKDLEEITSVSKELLKQVLGHSWGSIDFVEGDKVIFNSLRDDFPKDFSIPLDAKSIIVRAIKTKETQLVHDVTEDPDYFVGPSVDEENILFSELTVPIVVDDTAVGAINVEELTKNAFNQDDIRLIEILAQHVASSVRRVREEGIRAQQFIELTYKLNNLEPGDSYICESHDRCFKVFAELSLHGVAGICLVRDDPEKLVERYGLDTESVRLLSSRPIKGFEALNNLQDISMTISKLLKEESGPVILLDGIEYMISLFGFEMVYNFLQEKKFDILEADALLLIPIDILTLDEQQKALLSSELKTLT